MNKTLEMLYDEHSVITNAVGITDSLNTLRQQNPSAYKAAVRKVIAFLKGYADEYHHYKEEVILFPEMSKKNELFEGGIIKEMTDNHQEFREMIKLIEASLNEGEFETVQKNLEKYVNMLLDHIAVENEEVFHAAESLFTEAELENIGFRFLDIDRELGNEKKESLAEIMNQMKSDMLLL